MAPDNAIANNRSLLKEFLASIATIQGDLSNITAPPFVLAEHSTVELPQYWADHPSLFVAPALETEPEKRALLVLKWFLGSLRNQQYAGRKEEDGVKKPLNAFLGELFLGKWEDEELGETRLVSEQVSHHPPVTACYLWNDKFGIRAEGFTQQEITFSGSVSIKQKGYAILHIDKYEEDYLIPVPNVKVKGILSGTPYPELSGTYSIISSTGFVAEIKFEGKGLLIGGTKNGFEAKVFRSETPDEVFYTAKGQWNGSFTIHDSRSGQEVEHFDINAQQSLPIHVGDISAQDPWESRKAWSGVREALQRGDMKGTSDAKSVVEQAQRKMRKDEQARGEEWQRVFFQRVSEDALFQKLSAEHRESFTIDAAGGIWKVDTDAIRNAQKPYHDALLPAGQVAETASGTSKLGHDKNGTNGSAEAHDGVGNMSPKRDEVDQGDEGTSSEAEKEKLEKMRIEEILRQKYSSSSHRR
ncbi:Oxysterol-binding protein [Corynespora cassiicola Philippines]|uniref:Oxysterol-binding protein n=1 Tax=Corynespora cassiicola Philippines TaxID=1448308 RepID=A0A2T2N9Q6_CORCC|nr:Oxysterol-binding protein [Corynespora cassiicola Philippines]